MGVRRGYGIGDGVYVPILPIHQSRWLFGIVQTDKVGFQNPEAPLAFGVFSFLVPIFSGAVT